MGKQILILSAIIFTGGLAFSGNVHAEEVDCVADPANAACVVTTSDEYNTMPIAEPVDDYPVFDDDEVVDNSVLFVGEDSDGDEEVIAEDEEVEEEPAVWPMYVSLGALGLAVLTFIILNLFSPRLKK